MRFFTPDLYRRFNSPDDEEADAANEAWEQAVRDYRRHLDAIRDRLPAHARTVAELCLHDATVLAFEEDVQSLPLFPEAVWPRPVWAALAILSVAHGDRILSLIYVLGDHIRSSDPSADWPVSKGRKDWLYDEVDLAARTRGLFLHRILFSDGGVVEIPFLSVILHTIPLPGIPAPRTA